MSGLANDLHITSNIEIDAPGFDKINAKTLKGQFEYKNKQLSSDSLLIETVHGMYYWDKTKKLKKAIFPLDLNLTYLNEENLFHTKQIEIAHNPLHIKFRGKTNNIEFLPPYFDILDSLHNGVDVVRRFHPPHTLRGLRNFSQVGMGKPPAAWFHPSL